MDEEEPGRRSLKQEKENKVKALLSGIELEVRAAEFDERPLRIFRSVSILRALSSPGVKMGRPKNGQGESSFSSRARLHKGHVYSAFPPFSFLRKCIKVLGRVTQGTDMCTEEEI